MSYIALDYYNSATKLRLQHQVIYDQSFLTIECEWNQQSVLRVSLLVVITIIRSAINADTQSGVECVSK